MPAPLQQLIRVVGPQIPKRRRRHRQSEPKCLHRQGSLFSRASRLGSSLQRHPACPAPQLHDWNHRPVSFRRFSDPALRRETLLPFLAPPQKDRLSSSPGPSRGSRSLLHHARGLASPPQSPQPS
uniref:Uncharacterized protein n=1 Tax=Toxoplasma gondii COUG TaxID=1074873 RepID=A0A2G8YAS4_TOXGO|nr:hypothetical protein TGCOUG_391660 [Toxoplasma gondii COUG]